MVCQMPSRKVLTFFLEGLMSGFPWGISAHVLCEKIKAMFHVRNDCLRGESFQTSLFRNCSMRGLISPSQLVLSTYW